MLGECTALCLGAHAGCTALKADPWGSLSPAHGSARGKECSSGDSTAITLSLLQLQQPYAAARFKLKNDKCRS